MEWTVSEGETHKEALVSLLKTLGADQSEVEIEELGEFRTFLGFGKPLIKMRGRLRREAFEGLPEPTEMRTPEKIKNKKIDTPPVTDEKNLSEIAIKSRDLLQNILQKMNIENSTVSVTDEKNNILLDITSDKGGLIIGHKGETLEALRSIMDIYANRLTEERITVTVDTENYRNRREDMLVSMAKKSAREVTKTGKEIYLGPMRPADRKLIHSCLQSHPKVTTKSEGEGGGRQVVVFPN